MLTVSVRQAVERLSRLSAARRTAREVRDALRDLTLEPSSLLRFLHFGRGRYTRNLIYRDANLEFLALCWDARTRSPIHDHAQQDCYLAVQSGAFEVQDYRLVEGGRSPGYAHVEPSGPLQRLPPGSVDLRGPENPLHCVALAPGQPSGVTLHVYSGPIDRCLVFHPSSRRCAWKTLSYDSVAGRIRIPQRSASDDCDPLIPDARD